MQAIQGRDPVDLRELLSFLTNLAKSLLECGCSSHRLENLCVLLGKGFAVQVEVFAIPTGVWLKVERGPEQWVDLIRVKQWAVNLDRLSRINRLVVSMDKEPMALADCRARLDELNHSSPPYKKWSIFIAAAFAAASYIHLNGGTYKESALGLCAGALAQGVGHFARGSENRRFLADFLGAATLALLVLLIVKIPLFGVDAVRLLTGGLIVYFPGLTFVNAIHEIAQKNLVSGSARLLEAVMVTVALAFGVGIVAAFASFFGFGR